MKKRYTIQYAWMYDVVVTIDHDICTDEHLHEINNFWGDTWDRKERLLLAGGDITKAVLKMLALRVLTDSVSSWGVIEKWRTDPPEGWPKLDGSYGIRLEHADDFELDDDEIEIRSEEVVDA
jgi:hypothetical protein